MTHKKTPHKKAGTKKKNDRIGKHGRCYRSGSSECSHRNRQFCDQRKQAKSGFIKKISRKDDTMVAFEDFIAIPINKAIKLMVTMTTDFKSN